MALLEKRILEISGQVALWQHPNYKEPITRLFEEIFPDKQQLINNLPGLKTSMIV